MSQPSATMNSYDEVPYPDRPVARSHPERLAAIATLFGMNPPPVDRCRVLELGCAAGRNLIPMADRHPESSFVGIDYSRRQIDAGKRLAEAIPLSNLDLRCASITDVGQELGEFDYIICHGVYSWVSEPVQDKILVLCRDLLSKHGVAYVSYNIFPGWHLRKVLRDLIRRHAPPGEPARVRLAKGRAVAQFLSDSLAQQPMRIAELLKSHADSLLSQPDEYIYHEEIEDTNLPLYFHEFASRAAAAGLQYLGEAAVATMFASNFGPDVALQIGRLADDVISAEQHMDVLRNRRFRQTLLCHQEVSVARSISNERIRKLFVHGMLRAQSDSPDLTTTANESFATAGGMAISSAAPLLKAAFYHIGAQWPRAVSIDELVSAAASLSGRGGEVISDADRTSLAASLVKSVASGMIEPTSVPDGFVTSISDRPQASRLARVEAATSKTVTNQRHEFRTLDDDALNIIRYLDGQHDRDALIRHLMAAFDRGELSIQIGGVPATNRQAVSESLRDRIERCLARLAGNALLVS